MSSHFGRYIPAPTRTDSMNAATAMPDSSNSSFNETGSEALPSPSGASGANASDHVDASSDSGDDNGSGGFWSFFMDSYPLFVATVFGVVVLVIVGNFVVRYFYQKRRGIDEEVVRRRNQELNDRRIAQRIQREMDRSNGGVNGTATRRRNEHLKRLRQRRERLEWYQTFLQPYKVTLREEDFVTDSCGAEKATPTLAALPSDDDNASCGRTDDEDDDDCRRSRYVRIRTSMPRLSDMAPSPPAERNEKSCGNCCHDDDLELGSRCQTAITTETAGMGQQRVVEGTCTVCLRHYVPGDTVIWAAHENKGSASCPHAFHEECIMTWLSTGKKRCPVCRRFFVPPARIADQRMKMRTQQNTDRDEQQTDLEEADEGELVEGGGDSVSTEAGISARSPPEAVLVDGSGGENESATTTADAEAVADARTGAVGDGEQEDGYSGVVMPL